MVSSDHASNACDGFRALDGLFFPKKASFCLRIVEIAVFRTLALLVE